MMEPKHIVNISKPLPVHRLDGKVVIITGGGGRIGVETAGRLLREGANVCLVDISKEALSVAIDALKGALSTGQPFESRIHTILADVTSSADVESYTKKTVRVFGRLDCVFMTVEIRSGATTLLDSKEEDFEKLMQVNVKSAWMGLKHAAAAMRDAGNGGSIVLTSSIAGLRGTPGHILYSASKFALRGLALTAANELGQYGIRVNTIHPSGLDTPISNHGTMTPEEVEESRVAMPLGRFAKADDIASVVAFLASEDSKFMTGDLLKIDGGSAST